MSPALNGSSVLMRSKYAVVDLWHKLPHIHSYYLPRQKKKVTVMSRKYAPSFCNLSLSTKRRGLYAGCDNFSRDYALPSDKANSIVICWWGVEAKRESLPNARRRDAPDDSGRVTNFGVEGRESRALPRSSWRVHR